jgi:hypothetical protein
MSRSGKVFNGVLVGLILALSVCAAMAVTSAQVQAPISPVETLKSQNTGSSTDNDDNSWQSLSTRLRRILF